MTGTAVMVAERATRDNAAEPAVNRMATGSDSGMIDCSGGEVKE
jgi:hypothetical protein